MHVGVYVSADFVSLELGHNEREVAGRRYDAEDHALKGFQLKAGEVPQIRAWNEEGASETLLEERLLEDTDPGRVHGLTS